jgi:predicted DNA-binding ribbon-helix-helix protein
MVKVRGARTVSALSHLFWRSLKAAPVASEDMINGEFFIAPLLISLRL